MAGDEEAEEKFGLSAGEEERSGAVPSGGVGVGELCSVCEERDCVDGVREMLSVARAAVRAAGAAAVRLIAAWWSWSWEREAGRRRAVAGAAAGWARTEAGGGSGPGVAVAVAREVG